MKLKIFDNFNDSGKKSCPVCNTSNDGKTLLIAIEGTFDDGIVECGQVHLDCISLQMNLAEGIIYQKLSGL